MENFYTVILKDPHARVEQKILGQQLAKALEIPFIDAMPIVKRHYGCILADRLEGVQAERLVAGLEGAGFPAISIPSGEMATLEGGGMAQRIEYYDEYLRAIIGSPGKAMDFPWEEITILMVGQLVIEKTSMKVETVKSASIGLQVSAHGVGIGMVQHSEPLITHEKQVDQKLMACVVSSDGRSLDLPGKGLLYSHLGDRLRPSSMDNYITVLSDIQSACPQAFCTEAFSSFLEGGSVPTYPNHKALDEEAIWLLQLDRLGLLPECTHGV